MTTREPHHSRRRPRQRRLRSADRWLILAALLTVSLALATVALWGIGDKAGAQILGGLSSEALTIAGLLFAQRKRNDRRDR